MQLPEPRLPDQERVGALLRILTQVAAHDYSEKPPLSDGDDPLSRLSTGLRFMIEDLEEAYRASQQEIDRLRELNALKAEFANIAAHELRTPLTPLFAQLHMLKSGRRGPLTPDQVQSLEAIDRTVQRLNKLVEDMLDASRIEACRFTLRRIPSDLDALVVDAVQSHADEAVERGIDLRIEASSRAQVLADPSRVAQVLANLLSNALKFTPGGGRVEVTTQRDGDLAVVRVRDTGIGLRPQDLGKLFQPFIRLRPSDVDRPGTGLGLHIAKGIVTQHGGELWCDSAGEGKGALFCFTLPIREHGEAPSAPAETSSDHPV